jgi:hypothetical protein
MVPPVPLPKILISSYLYSLSHELSQAKINSGPVTLRQKKRHSSSADQSMDQAAGGPDIDTANPAFSVGSGSYPPPFKYTYFIYWFNIFAK